MSQTVFTSYQQQQQQNNTVANNLTKAFDFGSMLCDAGKVGVDIFTGAYDSRRNNNFNPAGYGGINYCQPNGMPYNGCPYPYVESAPQQSQFFGPSSNNSSYFYNGNQQTSYNPNQMYQQNVQNSSSGYPGFWNVMYGK